MNVGVNRLTIDSAGKVGINQTSPDSLLHIEDDNTLTKHLLHIKGGGASGAYGVLVEAANGTDLFKIDTSSYKVTMPSGYPVGIGTNAPAYKLEVKASVTGDWLSRIYNTATTSNPSGLLVRIDDADSTGTILGVNNAGSYHMVVKGDGKVGIGTNAPTSELHLYTTSGNNYLKIENQSTSQAALWWKTGTTDASWIAYIPSSSSDLRLYAGADKVTFKTDGKVGIGTTAPGALLHCIGGAGGVNIAKFERTSGASGHVAINVNGADPQIVFDEGTVEWAVGVKDTDNSFRIADNSTIGTNDVFTLDTSGNCGIGTTSPAHLLEVESTTAWQGSAQINQKSDGIEGAQLFLKHTSASPADNDYLAFLHFKGMNSAAQEVQYARIHATSADVTDGTEDGSLFFNTAVGGTANTNVMSLVGGKVGIGTTSPAAKLQANGEIRIVSSASYNTHLNYLDTGTNFITTTNSGTTSFRGSNNNITTMTVKGDGKVSINKAINTAVSLSVNAPASNTTNYGLEICNASSNTRFIVDGVGNTSFYGSDNSLSARVTSDGKVGIGTTVPGSYKLYVNGNTWVQGSLETSGQLKAGTSLAIGSSGSGGYTLPATDGTNGYVLKTNGSGTVTWQADSSGGGGGSGDITSVIGGNAIDVSGGSSGDATVNHADTSTQASVNNSGYLVVQDITLDAYGHVTGINSKTVGDTTGFALTSYGTCGVRLTWTEAGTSETDTAYPTGCGGGGGS